MREVIPLSEPVDRPRNDWLRKLVGAVALVIVGWLLLTQVIFTGDSDKSSTVMQTAGASSCQSSGYQISNRLDGSETTIYDCNFPSGRQRCVTLENGLTRDVTAEVRLLFADTLGADKPTCVG